MPKKATELSAVAVRRLTKPGLYPVGGVAGLCLQVKDSGARSWILRATVGVKRRDMGLGGFPDVQLADAREAARRTREKIIQGIDPVGERQAARAALMSAQVTRLTFDEAARRYVASKSLEFRNPKHAKQWSATLETYASPVIGSLSVADVELRHLVQILQPIWSGKTETASRLRGRIENVLAWATVSGFRSGDNPARWRGHLDAVLPAPGKVRKVKHHAALPWSEVPAFMKKLRAREGMGARCLEFAILTAARSGEVRLATWDEIDLKGKVWTVPADRMKAGRDHRVPLSADAIKLLKALPHFEGCAYVFPSSRNGPLSDATLSALLDRMAVPVVPHGFRSTFRDWTAERTAYPRDVAEMALAHTIGDKVEAAYRRGDLLAKRTRLMAEWARFLSTPLRKASVTSIGRAR